MKQNNMLAMILAGGRGSRLHDLTNKVAKPAVSYGGKYRIIDFPLSNCANSGIDTVGVLTQYESILLNSYVAAGRRWGLDAKNSGVYVLPPREKADTDLDVYRGTADAMYQNISFLKKRHEPYVIITSGDCVYKIDYNKVLEYHIEKKADITVVCKDMAPDVDVSRFGVVRMNEDSRIVEFEEKPMVSQSNTISTGIYIVRRRQLIEMLERSAEEGRWDFVTDILIRYKNMKRIYGYKMKEYWSNIATVESYYQTNMDFLKPEVRRYFFHDEPKIYSKVDDLPPAKYNAGSDVRNSLIASGCIVNSKVENSILFKKVFVGKNCVIKNSIILNDVYIGDNTHIENCIVESRDTLKANTYYCGDNGIKIVSENNERYVL